MRILVGLEMKTLDFRIESAEIKKEIEELKSYKKNFLGNLKDQETNGLTLGNTMTLKAREVLLELDSLKDKKLSMMFSDEDTDEIDLEIKNLEKNLPSFDEDERAFVTDEINQINQVLQKLNDKQLKVDSRSDKARSRFSKEYVESVVAHARELEKTLIEKDNQYMESEAYKKSPLAKVLKNYENFPEIDGFKKRGTSTQSQTSIINGQVSSSQSIVMYVSAYAARHFYYTFF
ncbi:MAG: protein BatD [Thermales bacterium]|nr:protein BatD [Thermales bacterium]